MGHHHVLIVGQQNASNCKCLIMIPVRYPNEKGILYLTQRLPEIASGLRKGGALCDDAIDEIRSCDHGLEGVEQNKMLHPEGEAELMGIGERFRARFPDLFKNNSGNEFRFRSTSTERAVRSRFV